MKKLLCFVLFLALPTVAAAASRYETLVTQLRKIHEQHPNTTQLVELTKAPGKFLTGIKIGNGIVEDLVVATHHGNEYGSTHVAMALIEELSRTPIPLRTTFVIPVINTTGYDRNSRDEEGWDPNRDWPGPCGNENQVPFRLASIKAVGDFIAAHHFVMAVTLHTYQNTVTYPWSFKRATPTEHDADFQAMAAQAAKYNKYRTGKTPDLIYTTRGDFESFAFWKHGIWPFLFEMGSTHTPNASALAELARLNVPAIRALLETGPQQVALRHDYKGDCKQVREAALLEDLHDE